MAMPATLPTTPPTTAFLVSGVSPVSDSGVDCGVEGAAAGAPVPSFPFSPGPAAIVGPSKIVVVVNRVEELLLSVEVEVEENVEEENVVLVVFAKSPTVPLLKSAGTCAAEIC